MLRAALVAAVLAISAVAAAGPPGMTPPIGAAGSPVPPPYAQPTPAAPTYAAPTYAPSTTAAPSTYAAPQTYAPSAAPFPTTSAPPGRSTYAPYAPAGPSNYAPSYYPAPPSGPVSEQPSPATSGAPSYRALTIGSDFLAIGMFAYAVDDNDDDLLALSLGTYALGAPLAHLIKGRTGTALASVGMRLGFPLVGAMIGEAVHTEPKCQVDTYPGYIEDCGEEGPSEEAVLGLIVGVGTAMVVDSAYLARGDKPKVPPQPQWSPTLRASQNGFALGAAGTF